MDNAIRSDILRLITGARAIVPRQERGLAPGALTNGRVGGARITDEVKWEAYVAAYTAEVARRLTAAGYGEPTVSVDPVRMVFVVHVAGTEVRTLV